MKFTLQSRLALVALGLGALAAFGDPYGGGGVKIRPRELAAEVQREVDHVTAQELSGWILQGRGDFRLIDLRDAASYAAYHIPQAENLPITDLPGDSLARNEKIVLYSDGGIHSAQAWFLLKAEGYKGVYILRGGLDEWNERIRGIQSGTPGSVASANPAAAPAAASAAPAPPPPPAAPAAAPKKKKKEGC